MTSGQVSVEIDAPPAAVWAIISDVTRTGEWSPECVSTEWLGGAQRAVAGARFVGHNKSGSRAWDMEAVIDEVEEDRALTFHTERDGVARTRWRYTLEPAGTGTLLTESWERLVATPLVARLVERVALGSGGRAKHNEDNLRASLAKIKAIAEA